MELANGRKPDFIGIGAYKSGTTWIYLCLREHPQIYTYAKEINFFSFEFDRGFNWYESFFKDCPSDKITGEFSPSYFSRDHIPQLIYDYHPKAKLIFSFRNPVERAFSHYLHNLRFGHDVFSKHGENESFLARCADDNRNVFLNNGNYATQLKRYLRLFSKDQILLLIYEDIAKDPLGFMQKVYRFLEIDPFFIPSSLNERVNTYFNPRLPFFNKINPVLRGLSKITGFGYNRFRWVIRRSKIQRVFDYLNDKKTAKPEINLNDRKWLANYYKQEIAELEEIINRRLSEWKI